MSRLSKERYAHASAFPNIPERMDEPIQDGIRRAFKIGRKLTEIEQILLQLELDAVRAERDAALQKCADLEYIADNNETAHKNLVADPDALLKAAHLAHEALLHDEYHQAEEALSDAIDAIQAAERQEKP